MAELALHLPNGRECRVNAPDGEQQVDVTILECACNCGLWFQPATPTQKFFNEQHQIDFNSEQRPRKTKRASKKK